MEFKETEKVELKEIYVADIKKEAVAFCNTTGGIIYIGVADNGNIVGVENIDETIQKVTNSLRDSVNPDMMMFVNVVAIRISEHDIIKVTIDEGSKKPYYLSEKGLKPSGVYVRQGTSSVQASEDAIRNMIKLADGFSYEDAKTYNQQLNFSVLETELSKRNIIFGEMQMETLKLTNNGVYTNLALLLSDECEHTIKIAVFQDTTKSTFLDRKEFTGSVLNQLNKAYEYIILCNKKKATFSGLLRVDTFDYPESAIREVLLNTVVHRDYSMSGSTIINIYSDRIEFISLGGLTYGLTIEAAMAGASQTRNPKLATLFFRMELIEAYGTGISKVIDVYEKYNLKPNFYIADGVFKVTLPNVNFSN